MTEGADAGRDDAFIVIPYLPTLPAGGYLVQPPARIIHKTALKIICIGD